MRYRELPNTQRFEAWLFSLSINIQYERFASFGIVSILSLSFSSAFSLPPLVTYAYPFPISRVCFSLSRSRSFFQTLTLIFSLSLSLVHSDTFSHRIRYSYKHLSRENY